MPRFQSRALPLSLAGLLLLGTGIAAVCRSPLRVSAQSSGAPASPAAILAAAYRLPFGPNPYLPSEAKADFAGFLQPADIPSAAYCGHCHAEAHAQWRQSAHANSFRAPWYLKNVQQLIEEKGIEYTRHCEGCHNPSALFTGALSTGSKVARPNDDDGITCMACHSIQRIQSTRGTGSYVMAKPAVLLDAAGAPLPGLPTDAEILAHPDRHRRAVMQPFYRTSAFCSVCHKAAMPGMLNGYKWLRTFSTYDDWQQSSWSMETPLPFYKKVAVSSCQSCHMTREPSRDRYIRGGVLASHRWLGANTAVPAQYGYTEQAARTEQFLKDDKVEIDIFAVTVEHTPVPAGEARFNPASLIAPLGSRGFTVTPGDWVRVDVVVRNKGIGHTLDPELRDFYESWLDFQATDDRGRSIYRSGAVDPATHRVDPEARFYTTRILDNKGKSLDHHEVWKIYTRAYDGTILPGRSDVVRYRFRVPLDAKSFDVAAALRYRRFNRNFTDWVYGDNATQPDRFPTITLANSTFHFNVGDNLPLPPHPTAPDATDQLRWNNYGIGMLDRQQIAEAVNAFTQVVAIAPKYEPGYVNVAVAEYSRGRYEDATRWLDRAARLEHDDPRAEYFRGLTLRWTNHYDAAIAVLKPVATRFPRFRQVHQELGYLYMVQRKFAESRAEYEAVLRIDPDDPITHRWLGAVYTALGDKTRAAQEIELAAQTGTDTAAGWTAQRYWRDNLTVAAEAMPTHTHSAGGLHDDADVRRVLQLQNPPSYIWVEHY